MPKYFDLRPNQSQSFPQRLSRPQKKFHWRWFFLSLGIIFLILGIAAGYFNLNVRKAIKPNSQEFVDFKVDTGESVIAIATNLKNQNLIGSAPTFIFFVAISGNRGKLQPGTYYFSPSMNIIRIVHYLSLGKTKERRVTIPEGWRLTEIAKKVEGTGLVSYANFLDLVSEKSSEIKKYPFLSDKPANASLEGYLFPDTYQFDKDTTPQEIVDEMLVNFDKKVDSDLRSKILTSNKKLFEILIIASLVEREAKFDEDRAKIASVFYNRLAKGMKLEADPTIQYALGDWQPISQVDYQSVDSSYNTYKVGGLPPGPICNPGIKSIEAATEPAKTDYLYFFHLADGTTIYSKTAEEHAENREKYKQ